MRTRRSPRNQQRLYNSISLELAQAALKERLFIGCFPTGLVYCDKSIEEHGDYKKIAYLNYNTLELEIYSPKSPLLPAIKRDAIAMQHMRGKPFPIAGNMTVILGGREAICQEDGQPLMYKEPNQ